MNLPLVYNNLIFGLNEDDERNFSEITGTNNVTILC